jgi:urease accessory protein
MLYITRRLGNIHTHPDLSTQAACWKEQGSLDEVTIDERDAHKSRLRLRTHAGRDLGLLLPRGAMLADGDVFAVEEEVGGVLVHIALQEVMVLSPVAGMSDEERLSWAVRLGHVLGNQHWPVAVVGEQVLTTVTIDRAVMETVLRTHHITEHFSIRYERRAWPEAAGGHSWTTPH